MNSKFLLIIGVMSLTIACGKSSPHSGSAGSDEEVAGSFSDVDKTLEYRVGLFKDSVFDPKKVTHIIVVGSAMKVDSDQFFQSGLSRAHRYKEVFPSRQVVIMSTPDVVKRTDEEIFNKYKIKVVKKVNARFTASLLIKEMSAFSQIASFDFFGHSSPWALKIDDLHAPFDPSGNHNELVALRKSFIPGAYATMNGCNTGFSIAPNLSKALGIPVSGSLTSSVFERVEADGHWYKEGDKNRSNYVTSNRHSFSDKLSCALGVCTRMKASRHNYSSIWGHFKEGGLSFDKFFCNFADAGDGQCEKGMALSLFGFPSVEPVNLNSRESEFKKVVFDWLCSTGKSDNYFNDCANGIEAAIWRDDLVYKSHPSNELHCDFRSCNTKVTCVIDAKTNTPAAGTCKLITTTNPNPSNITREYLSLMRGFDQIRQ